MNNWFYMNRTTFECLLRNELGGNLTEKLLLFDFDIAISFMIGETSDEILTKIQQTFSRRICHKIVCDDHCVSCSFSPPIYAKLSWFVQRLLAMNPLSKPFVKPISLSNQNSTYIKHKNRIINTTTANQQDLSNINENKNGIKKNFFFN